MVVLRMMLKIGSYVIYYEDNIEKNSVILRGKRMMLKLKATFYKVVARLAMLYGIGRNVGAVSFRQ